MKDALGCRGCSTLSSGYSEQDYSKLGLVLTIQSLHMPAKPRFINDKLEILVRKCIVFPADGSETRLVHMVARTVTVEDIPPLAGYSRCVDMASTFGDEYRKTQVLAYKISRDGVQSTYLFFYNLSPNLPINLSIARVIGVTPSHLKSRKRLFWRGDVVAMKVQPESESIVESLDADLFDLNPLEEFFRMRYQGGSLESFLDSLEQQCEQEFWAKCQPSQESLQGISMFHSTVGLIRYCSAPQQPTGVQTRQNRKVKRTLQLHLVGIELFFFRNFSTRPQRATMC